jgi:hypothetical protein
MHLVDHSSPSTHNGTFTTQELARLAAYRAAVAAGFYTDWDGSAASTDTRLLARLRRFERAGAFSAQERQRLVQLRKRVVAGDYAGDQPLPAETAAPTRVATDESDRPLAD